MALILIDGLPEKKDSISAFTWGCAYGYGLFETLLILRNRPVFLEQHLKRMRLSAGLLQLAMPEEDDLIEWVWRLLRPGNVPVGKLKITLLARERIPGEEKIAAHTVLSVQPGRPYPESLYETGVSIGLLNQTKNENSVLVKHKTLNYLENLLGREQARKNNWFEGLFHNTKGRLCEGTVSNLFLVKDQTIITPGVREGLLPGVTREIVINLARRNKLPVAVGKITEKDLSEADEVFLTNSLFGIMPVTRIGDKIIRNGKPGELTKSLMNLYKDLLKDRGYL
ncbi:aminotransferase class IV [Desulforamulus putei]|uniref:Branched-chain amino acid aminotransferase n=1 Tax=Desulforamulus putei DSM 12395 TaxID=1121429 RepID=A0A1M4XIV9_9FIRM|nr:aminotransferase class IV [Desulforamulus putei]SHE93439.1 branched-chain amino acid aminotransferase [Desulforamulus putei DSM 12395]